MRNWLACLCRTLLVECVRNCIAQVVRGACSQNLIKPVLKELHWLPICARISFKIATFVHKVRTSQSPAIILCRPHQRLETGENTSFLIDDFPRGTSYEEFDWSQLFFLILQPRHWNNLPVTVRSIETLGSFMTPLKKHVFELSFVSSRTFFSRTRIVCYIWCE